jgi:hypothetical protein
MNSCLAGPGDPAVCCRAATVTCGVWAEGVGLFDVVGYACPARSAPRLGERGYLAAKSRHKRKRGLWRFRRHRGVAFSSDDVKRGAEPAASFD